MRSLFCLAAQLRADEQAAERPATPRELFRMLGVGDDYFNRLTGGGLIHGDQEESPAADSLPAADVPARDVDRWAMQSRQLVEAIERPERFRGSIFRLRGRVLEVEPLIGRRPTRPPAMSCPKYFRCRLQLDVPDETAEVYTENVPAAWRKGCRSPTPAAAPSACF